MSHFFAISLKNMYFQSALYVSLDILLFHQFKMNKKIYQQESLGDIAILSQWT